MKKIQTALIHSGMKARHFGMQAKQKVVAVLSRNNGEGFVDTALKILISVVVGALLLAGLYMLFKDTLLPTLTKRIIELFDFKG